ncbi:MAG: phage tail protein, partial [Gemmatimonadetes bacterium]|nr:phage tail protein [Gemmatimonadota bacterium]
VVLDGINIGGWSKCDGLTVNLTLMNYTPLGTNTYMPILPDRVTYDKITLSRAVNDIDSKTLLEWLGKRANNAASGTGAIAVMGSDRLPVMTYQLRGVYPTKYKGPSLDANSKGIAIETLELAHEGFLPEV